MKNTWNGINSRLDTAEEKFNELKDSDGKLWKMKYAVKKKGKKWTVHQCVSFKWPDIYVLMESKTRRERKEKEKTIWRNKDWKCSKSNENHKLTHLRNSRNYQKHEKVIPRYIIIRLLKIRNKEITVKAAREKRHVTYQELYTSTSYLRINISSYSIIPC